MTLLALRASASQNEIVFYPRSQKAYVRPGVSSASRPSTDYWDGRAGPRADG